MILKVYNTEDYATKVSEYVTSEYQILQTSANLPSYASK